MRPLRVLIVEDSAVVREHLRRIISADPRFEVAAMASSGEEALQLVDHILPDVISMDIRLPGMQGFEATRRIMSSRPTPIVVVSGIGAEEVGFSMLALKAGALSVVEKPVAATHEDYDAMADRLCTQLAIMSQVKVVRQRAYLQALDTLRPCIPAGGQYRLLGVAASTGGPAALLQLFSELGPGFPLPIVVVQHMTRTFTEGFAEWLGQVAPLSVKIVQNRMPLLAGSIYLAPGDRHLVVEGGWVAPNDGPAVGCHRPSADVLFLSMAHSLGSSAIGVLLTGMGEDGAAGLRELRAAGGFTLAENESTAVVYGMPGAAVKLNAVCESLPLRAIAARLQEIISPIAGEN